MKRNLQRYHWKEQRFVSRLSSELSKRGHKRYVIVGGVFGCVIAAGLDIIFAKKKEMDFMQFLLILAPA